MTISGTAQVGQTLSAILAPSGAAASYKWQRADEADGSYSDISNAVAATYQLAAEDQEKFIKVEATGTGKYSGTVTSQATAAVAAAE